MQVQENQVENEQVIMSGQLLKEQYVPDVSAPDTPVPEVQEPDTVDETAVSIAPDVYTAVYNAFMDAAVAADLEENATDGQMVNSTALSYFEGILGNQTLPVDYVIYTGAPYTYNYNGYERTAYEYCMMYGDLMLDGVTFSGENVTVVRMRTSGNVSVEYETVESMSVSAPMYYSRSNLGAYSGIIQYDYSGLMLLLCAVLGGVIWFMGRIMCLKR